MKKSPQCDRARLAGSCPYLHNESAHQERERSEDESRTSPANTLNPPLLLARLQGHNQRATKEDICHEQNQRRE